MTYTKTNIQSFLATVYPFDRLPPERLTQLAQKFQLLRYRMGQGIVMREQLVTQVAIIYEGQGRLLGHDPRTQVPVTLKLLQPGEMVGWVGLVRGFPCETAIASIETICLTLPAADFLTLLEEEPSWTKEIRDRCSVVEAFELLGAQLQRQANATQDLKQLALQAQPNAVVRYLSTGKNRLQELDSDRLWLVSGGGILLNHPKGSRLEEVNSPVVEVIDQTPARIVGFLLSDLGLLHQDSLALRAGQDAFPSPDNDSIDDIPYAPEPSLPYRQQSNNKHQKYPHVRGRGTLNATLACFQMLSQHLNLPFRKEVIRRIISNQLERSGSPSLQLCGGVAELMGLNAQLVTVPAAVITRLPTPAMIRWRDSFAIVYESSDRELVLGSPETGISRRKPADFIEAWGDSGEVLLLKPTKETPKQKFSLRWFIPSLIRYRKVLLEVFIASFFVQLFGLANPLMIQVIIDTVLTQNSLDTLHVLGIFLVVVAIFEALLTSLRTYLFVDTTNRIDLALGSEIIDHLLRLPLRYFERRPVGELATRINELENIRSFLTGTALTVVLDAIFSVIYIVVMLIYSWQLTLVALATVPAFALLTIIVSPIVRRQLRVKAERNAQTQSYLVEVLSGIQTVKAQNIELRSRWYWQERYSRYVTAGFQTVLTNTTASSTSSFLNKLSGLLVLWVGAYLVLQGELSLGQLIAFRIIASYVTSPLLRLVQLWQNFQETALSLERLSDIVDSPQEATEEDRKNIPMPVIQGAVRYDNVCFQYNPNTAPQLDRINLDFPAGIFIGVVGLSGSGKSTLTKLIPRLYEANTGRILIDDYDISKVELYSLRQQIGVVPQDTLLFDGSVQDNIALTQPDATSEEIIEAAKVAVAHDFIMSLPSGYNTRVGERGSALSGGQRQRIAIARTILQNPRLLVLDEATSALDYDTERQVCLNLAEHFRGRTVFFITHRLGTIRHADAIVVMDRGSVVEQGTHEELMELRGRYYCLYIQQEAQVS
ncbi:MAG: peptidase domain-containing ABC transporter [Kastovskya adunca ATA6-11-RM4]|jgi:ATP-binding cassette subfamily B protein|nr:peptidase domain-containing ABC transporter [Kastovskya adunca ATA6-11-RM4]